MDDSKSISVQSIYLSAYYILVNTSIVTKMLSSSCTYVTETLIPYTAQNISKAWIALAHATRM